MANRREVDDEEAPAVWLDLLPMDVCSRISSMLPSWKLRRRILLSEGEIPVSTDLDPIELAAVSSVQRLAAAEAQDRIIRAECINHFEHASYLICAWHRILGNDIREVRLSTNIHCSESDEIRKVLSLPSIVKATIPHNGALLKALQGGGTVKRLEVEFTGLNAVDNSSLVDLVKVLRSCAVEELRMICGTCISRKSVHCYALKCMDMETLVKGSKCTSLRKLALLCHSKRLEQSALRSGFAFPNLEELYLEHCRQRPYIHGAPDEAPDPFYLTVSPSLEERLHALRSVSIINCGPVDQFVPILGKSLKAITTTETVSSSSLEKLERCPSLEYVHLVLENEADAHFPTNLRSIRSLSLLWPVDEGRHPSEEYYSPRPNVLLGIIRRNEQLKELRLQNANIPHELLEDMLIILGPQLLSLQLPLFGGQYIPDQIKRIMRLLMKYNPNVVDLSFGAEKLHRKYIAESGLYEHSEDLHPNYCEERNDWEGWKRADAILQVLNRRLPRLSAASINEFRWCLWRFEQVRRCSMQ